MLAGFRPKTQKTYSSAQKQFIEFCNSYSRVYLPCDADTVLMYISYLFHVKHLSSQTIKVYMSAIRAMHVTEGLPNPTDNVRIKLALKAVESQQIEPPHKKMAITYQILSSFSTLLGNGHNDIMLWSAMTLAHFGCMRTAEFVAINDHAFDGDSQLRERDVSFCRSETGEVGMCIYLKRCKTDPTGKGMSIYIGCTGARICAVCAMQRYLTLSTAHSREHPLFRWDDGRYLTRAAFVKRTKEFIKSIGLDSRVYSGHSYRIGAATSGSEAGLSPLELKLLGRWSSDAYQGYVRTPVHTLFSFARRMAEKHCK